MKLLITIILFLLLTVNVFPQKFTSLMDGFYFIQQKDIQYWVKKNKVKFFQLEFPGLGFRYKMRKTKIIFRYEFDSINYDLKKYRVFYEISHETKNYCTKKGKISLDSYSKTKDDDLIAIEPDKERIEEYGLNEEMKDIYGVKYGFFNTEKDDLIIHRSKTDKKGDTIYYIKHRHRYEPYFLNYLKLEINLDEPQNNKEIILFSYLDDDYRNNLQKELYKNYETIKYNHFHDTILYHKISKENNNLTGIKWQRTYTEENVNYYKNFQAKIDEQKLSCLYKDTISINESKEIKNKLLRENLKALTANSKFLNSIDKIIASNELKIKHNNRFFISSIFCKETELTILTKHHKIKVFEKLKPCIIEEDKNNKERVERYYLPKDESYSEKGPIVMQKVYNTNGELKEKYYNRNILLHPYIKNSIWRKEAYEYDLGVMIRQTNFTQSARRELSNRRNPQRISYTENEEFDYSEHNYFHKDDEDKNMLYLVEILRKIKYCEDNIMNKIVYYE